MTQDDIDFDYEADPDLGELPDRNLVVLVLDYSGSMGDPGALGGSKADELNAAIDEFLASGISEVPQLHQNGELAACGFQNQSATWLKFRDGDGNELAPVENGSPFYPARTCKQIERMNPSGRTPMAEALNAAMDALAQRKSQLDARGIVREYRPNMFLVTDGKPSSDISAAVSRVHQEEEAKRFVLWALGTHETYRPTLERLAGPDGTFMLAQGMSLSYFPAFMSASLSAQADGSGDGGDSAAAIKSEARLINDQAFKEAMRDK